MSWEVRGTFRPRVRLTCNRFPSCGWQGEEKEQAEEDRRQRRKAEEMEGKDHKTKINKKNTRQLSPAPC